MKNFCIKFLFDFNMIPDGREAKFTFNISDGLHTTEEHTFHIKTKPVQLQIHCRSLHIFPLQRKYITSSHLLTTVSDPTRVVTYEIVTPPTLGRLMMESEEARGIYKVVSVFTQDDLNNSKVFYEHTHQFSDLYANDSFGFNIKAHLARTLLNQVSKDITRGTIRCWVCYIYQIFLLLLLLCFFYLYLL